MLKLRTDEGKDGWVKVSLKYIPIQMELDPSESINNMGKLRVDVLDAVELPSADRNGKSDPYCKFELNEQEVYKTKVIKKTLNPTWNEYFEVAVPSRTGAKFHVNVYDYDFADKPDFLGAAVINLDSLEPFKASEAKYILDGKSGSIRLRLLFRPDYVTRNSHGTSTFSGLGAPTRIVTGVAGAPIKGGVAVAGVVGHGVGKGASFLKRGILGGKKDKENGTVPEQPEIPIVTTSSADGGLIEPGLRKATGLSETPDTSQNITTSQASSPSHARTKSVATSIHSTMAGGGPKGTATFTIVGASGYPSSTDLFVLVSQLSPKEKVVGKTKHFKASDGKWNFEETFKVSCNADAQFKIEAKGDHFIGSNDSLGEHVYFVDETGSGAAKELTVGDGTVTLKSTFQPAETDAPDTPKSHLRRSFLSKREPRASRESTPNP